MPAREPASRDLRRMALSGDELEYVLLRRRGRRGVGLKVDENGLTVSAPVTMPLARIEALVRESERWVRKKILEWSARKAAPVHWRDGERLPFLGGGLTLRVSQGARSRVERREGELHATVRSLDAAEIERAVVRWYKRAAADYFGHSVRHLSQGARLVPPKLSVSSALTRWGSCNSRREVRLAWRLMKAPADLVDYVICHELAHLRHMDHSAAFWSEVERQCPDYRQRRKRLHATDHLYRTF